MSSRAMQFKAKIRNLAERSGLPAQAVLQNFMMERLLERISLSPYKENLVLKGGMLIASLVGTTFVGVLTRAGGTRVTGENRQVFGTRRSLLDWMKSGQPTGRWIVCDNSSRMRGRPDFSTRTAA